METVHGLHDTLYSNGHSRVLLLPSKPTPRNPSHRNLTLRNRKRRKRHWKNSIYCSLMIALYGSSSTGKLDVLELSLTVTWLKAKLLQTLNEPAIRMILRRSKYPRRRLIEGCRCLWLVSWVVGFLCIVRYYIRLSDRINQGRLIVEMLQSSVCPNEVNL